MSIGAGRAQFLCLKEHKEHKEKMLFLCALWVLLRLTFSEVSFVSFRVFRGSSQPAPKESGGQTARTPHAGATSTSWGKSDLCPSVSICGYTVHANGLAGTPRPTFCDDFRVISCVSWLPRGSAFRV